MYLIIELWMTFLSIFFLFEAYWCKMTIYVKLKLALSIIWSLNVITVACGTNNKSSSQNKPVKNTYKLEKRLYNCLSVSYIECWFQNLYSNIYVQI